jgi:hypothetical protein
LTAQAVVMAFDDLPMLSHQFELQGISDLNTDLFYKGYRLVYAPAPDEPYPVGLAAVGPKWQFNGRSVALLINTCLGSLTISSEDNNPFSAKSIDLGTSNGDPSAAVTFFGTTPEGEVVTYSAQAGPALLWKRFEFPATFGRLQSLMWKQGDCINNMPHMFDNLELKR